MAKDFVDKIAKGIADKSMLGRAGKKLGGLASDYLNTAKPIKVVGNGKQGRTFQGSAYGSGPESSGQAGLSGMSSGAFREGGSGLKLGKKGNASPTYRAPSLKLPEGKNAAVKKMLKAKKK